MQQWGKLADIQPIATQIITNSIVKQRISHAYLLEGPKGTGKMEAAILLAKSIFCLNKSGAEPCQTCSNCKRITSGNHPNVYKVLPDGLSIKKQQIQMLQEEFTKTGLETNKKVYIIGHADRMTVNAANTLLKFLEEPSSEATAILVTEHSHQMLSTILSRCQMITFRPLSHPALVKQLQEQGIPAYFAAIAAKLTNNVDEALAYCHDEWFAQARTLVIKLCEALGKDSASLFFVQEKWVKHFSEKEQLQMGLDMLLLIYRDLLYVRFIENEEIVFQDQQDLLQSLSYSQKRIVSALSNILEAKKRLNANANAQLIFDQLVFRLQEG